MTRILGAVLAGGRSSRFGSDKAAALFGDRTLAARAEAILAPHVAAVVRAGAADGVPDRPRAHLGPLGGLAGALDHAARHGFDGVLSIACDMPRVSDHLIEALLRRMPSYCFDAPVLGVWPVSAMTPALALLAETRSDSGKDGPSLRHFARTIGALPVAADAPLPNVNTREDLLQL